MTRTCITTLDRSRWLSQDTDSSSRSRSPLKRIAETANSSPTKVGSAHPVEGANAVPMQPPVRPPPLAPRLDRGEEATTKVMGSRASPEPPVLSAPAQEERKSRSKTRKVNKNASGSRQGGPRDTTTISLQVNICLTSMLRIRYSVLF
jgi:hypothetical protein